MDAENFSSDTQDCQNYSLISICQE